MKTTIAYSFKGDSDLRCLRRLGTALSFSLLKTYPHKVQRPGHLAKVRLMSVGVSFQTLVPMLSIRQKVVCVFGMESGCGRTLGVI